MDIVSQLRWILIACGVTLLAGIYLWGRRYRGRDAGEETIVTSRPEPLIDAPEYDEPVFEPELAPEQLEAIEHVPLEVRPAPEDVIAPVHEQSTGRRDPVISDPEIDLTAPLQVESVVVEPEPAAWREPPLVTTTASDPVQQPERSRPVTK